MRKTEIFTAITRVGLDSVMIFLALIVSYFWRMKYFEISFFNTHFQFFPPPTTLFPFDIFLGFSLKFTLILVFVFAIRGQYRFGSDEKFFSESINVFWDFCAGMAILLIYFFFAKLYFFSRLIFGITWILGFLFVFWGRILIRLSIRGLHQKGKWKQRILLVGNGKVAHEVLARASNEVGLDFLGILTEKNNKSSRFKNITVLGEISSLESVCQKWQPHEVWIAAENLNNQNTTELIQISHINHAKCRIFPDQLKLDLAAVKVSTFHDLPIITLLNSKLDGWCALLKLVADFAAALVFFVLLLPIYAVIILKIWKNERSAPIFYRSKRVGLNGVIFDCYKFRTMVLDADKQKEKLKNERSGGVLFKIKNDPRVTPFGKFLRKYSLDELPQIWNVLRGDMSLIGPRPHLETEVQQYPKEHLQLLSIRPGITGFAQINGNSELSFNDEMKYETFYLKNWSLWLDTIIFIKTIFILARGKNR